MGGGSKKKLDKISRTKFLQYGKTFGLRKGEVLIVKGLPSYPNPKLKHWRFKGEIQSPSLYYRNMQFVEPEKYKQAKDKIQLFSEMAGGNGDVEDPYGMGREGYFRILQQIENYAKKIILSMTLSTVKE